MSTVTAAAPGPGSAAELAERYGLEPSSHRPGLTEYSRRVWEKRHFIVAFAQAQSTAKYSHTRLGQFWQVLTPLLQAALYYFVFGKLLGTHKGTPNFIAFLTTGVLIFHFINHGVSHGARAIPGNMSLIRALHFPRACLPISSILVDIQQLLVSMLVLMGIVLLTGEPITLQWLMLVPTVVLLSLFVAGLTALLARIGASVPDIQQLLPFILRTWLYLSGVFYNIATTGITQSKPILADVMYANPASVYIELARASLLQGSDVLPHAWPLAVFWALLSLLGGFVFFWRGEHSYGRG